MPRASLHDRLLAPLLAVLLLPSLIAVGFGWWSPVAAIQEHLALDLLLELLLLWENSALHRALVGEGVTSLFELGALLTLSTLLLGGIVAVERRGPRLLRPIAALPELLLMLPAGVVIAGAVALAAASERALFWSALCLGLAAFRAARTSSSESGALTWSAPERLPIRLVTVLAATALTYYGTTSLWEGATYHNPLFELRSVWRELPGSSPALAGFTWALLLGFPGLAILWRSRALPGLLRSRLARYLALLSLGFLGLAIWVEPIASRRLSRLLASPGLLLLAAGLGSLSGQRTWPMPGPWSRWDPRRILACSLPLAIGSAALFACGLTLSLWTTLPDGIPATKLSDTPCVFSLGVDPDDRIYFTDRCTNSAGMITEGDLSTWPLEPSGSNGVEELVGPGPRGEFWASIQAYAEEAQVVLLSVEGPEGPRTVAPQILGQDRAQASGLVSDDGSPAHRSPADKAHSSRVSAIPLSDCWPASWASVPGSGLREAVLGCENRSGVLVIDTDNRSIVGDVPLSGRLESAAFSPSGDRLFGLSLWGDPMLRSYDWPKGSERSYRLVGPFNWDVLAVPSDSTDSVTQDYSLWVPRFLEGALLILDPEDLSTRARLSLSFGIRAAHYEPRHHRVWLAAAYSGELWSISAAPPYDRVVFPLCGQTRDLTSDSKGRVIASSDCGVFRFDWTQ